MRKRLKMTGAVAVAHDGMMFVAVATRGSLPKILKQSPWTCARVPITLAPGAFEGDALARSGCHVGELWYHQQKCWGGWVVRF